MGWTNAFTQAKLDDPIWIHIPRGFSSKNTSFGHLCPKTSLSGTAAPMEEIDLLVAQLREHGMTLTREASLAKFLSIVFRIEVEPKRSCKQRE